MNDIKAIETEYNRYKFCSRLEARWAVFFDALNIPYEYKPDGFEFVEDGTSYLPDFYLPDCKQFFEAKQSITKKDCTRIMAPIRNGYPVVIGYPDGTFQACSYDGPVQSGMIAVSMPQTAYYSFLARCDVCGHYFFGAFPCYEHCPCCEWDRGSCVGIAHDRDNAPFTINDKDLEVAWKVAESVSFETGETLDKNNIQAMYKTERKKADIRVRRVPRSMLSEG